MAEMTMQDVQEAWRQAYLRAALDVVVEDNPGEVVALTEEGRQGALDLADHEFAATLAVHDHQVKAEALREAADDSEAVRQNADVAECAGHVPGETGRQAALDAADSMHEEPWAWMRARADQIEKEADR